MKQKVLPPDAILIPDNAQRVFEGQLFDVYQWPQEMFDGSVKTFEMLKRPDTVQVIVARGSKILLVNDEQPGRTPRLHMPGGRVDDEDESWLAAAQRELREEAGLVCKDWRLVSVDQPIPRAEWFVSLFMAQDITAELPQQLDADGEKITLHWKDFDEAQEWILTGKEPTMNYMVPFFSKVTKMSELLAFPEYQSMTVDR